VALKGVSLAKEKRYSLFPGIGDEEKKNFMVLTAKGEEIDDKF
jgi:hypothetical protein